VAPVNAGNFTLAISGNNVILQYSSSTVPTAAGTATPSPAFRNQNVLITVTATNGVGGTVNGVTVDASTIGVVSPVTLVNAGGNVWTNTVAVTPDTLAGGKTLVATVTATSSLNGITSIPLTVVVGNDVWNGAGTGNNFSTALNWTNKLAPGYVGDSLEFAAGVTDLTPNVDLAYIVTGITFDSGAGSYNLGGSTLTLSGSGSLVNNSANPQTLNVPLADSGGGLTKTGNGLISLAAANLYGGPTVVNAGTLSVPGSVSGGDVTVAGLAGNAALTVSGSLGGGTNTLAVGTVTNAVGAVWQTGGTISLGTGTAFFGHLPGGYGYGRIDGGTFSMSELQIGTWGSSGGNGGNALFEVNGGTVTDSGWLPMARGGAAQTGVLNMFSGSLSFAGGGLICNFGSGQTSIINILGGSVNSSSAGVGLGSGTSILNLNGGLLSVNQVGSWAPWSYQGNNGRVSFNGGTLQASAGSSAFLTVNSANIYSGGATIDNNGNAITIGQALLAPAGNGINSASVTSGGAGYIAPPIITITNATGDTTGIGATAIAQINPLTGVVTNVIVTCPGVNYTATPIFVVSGGGATTPAVITGATPTANPSGGLTSIGSGTLTLTNANTYTGNTTISNGTLALATGGSISSTNIIVISGTTFDPSASTFSMGNGQKLSGEGTVNGLVAGSGSKIFPGTDGTAGTLSFSGNLTLGSGATANFDLDTTYNGANDQINGSGTLTLNGNAIHIKAPSTSASLDHSGNDYVLITAGSISGSFASTPVWDVKPVNSANYTVVTSGSQVTLHYSSFTAPTGSGFATPSPAIHNQNVLITVTVTNGSGTVDPNTGVVLNAGTLDGSLSSVPLVLASTISSTVHVYTNTITVPMSAAAGSYTLSAVITDSNGLIGTANISLAVSTTEVWNGGGSSTNLNWSNDPNWVVGMAPELSGDSLIFAGTVGTAPNMDNNYSVTGLTFSNNATSFTIGSTTSSTLTLTANGIVNNSANAQTLNVPITMSAPQTFNAASGNITVSGAIDDAGNGYALTKTGTGALVLSGTNTYTGQTAVKAGTMSVTGGQVLSPTAAGPGLTIGDAGKAILNVSVGTVEGNTSDGEFGTGIVVGPTSGGAGAVVVSGTGSVTSGRQIVLGNAANSYGAWTQSGGTGGTGTNTGGFLVVGASSASGVFSQSGGTFTVGWNAGTIGAGNSSSFGVMNLSGGTFSSMATSGSYSTAGGLAVGEFGTAVLNVSGTASVNLSGNFNLTLGKNSGANGTVNLLGGTLATTKVSSGSGTGTFNFNGGTLQASTANASFMSGLTGAYVYSGGAVINDGGNAVTIAQPLLVPSGYGVVSIPVSNGGSGYIAAPVVTITNISASGSGATAVANVSGGTITSITVTSHGQGYGSGDTLGVALVGGGGSGAIIGTPVLAANTSGGLTKLGAGTLTLAGANTYTGNTTISAGTLELAQATLATNSTVSISNSAVLNLDFTTTNQISALVLGGVSQLPGVYNSTTTPTYISGTGSLVVPSATATNPTNITFSVTGGGSTLSLSWPADHLGWTLQQQTNSLSTGLSTNWVNVAGSESITSTNITIDPAKPTVFYRLVLP
jgi:autotransporter-associated beta strand protein